MAEQEHEKMTHDGAAAIVENGPSPPPPSPEQVPDQPFAANACVRSLKSAPVYEVTLHKDVFGLGIYFTEASGSAIVDPTLPFYRLPDGEIAPGEASGVIMPGDVLHAINGKALQGLAFASIVEELRCIPLGDVTLAFERPFPHVTLVFKTDQDNDEGRQVVTNQEDDVGQQPMIKNESVVTNQSEHDIEEYEKSSKRWSVFQRLSSTAASITGSSTTSLSVAALERVALEELLAEMELKLHDAEESLEREKKCRFLAERKNILYRNELLRVSEENTLLKYKLSKEKSVRAQKDEFCRAQLHLAI